MDIEAIEESEKAFQEMDKRIQQKQREQEFYQMFLEVAIDHLTGFVINLALIALGAYLAFYYMRSIDHG